MPEGSWGFIKVLLLQLFYSIFVGFTAAILIATSISFILYEDYINVPVIYVLVILETILVHYWNNYIVYDVIEMHFENIRRFRAYWKKFFFVN